MTNKGLDVHLATCSNQMHMQSPKLQIDKHCLSSMSFDEACVMSVCQPGSSLKALGCEIMNFRLQHGYSRIKFCEPIQISRFALLALERGDLPLAETKEIVSRLDVSYLTNFSFVLAALYSGE